MTKAELEGIGAAWSSVTMGTALNLAVGLSTTSAYYTPLVDQVTVNLAKKDTWQALPINTTNGIQVDMNSATPTQTTFTNKTGGIINVILNVLA